MDRDVSSKIDLRKHCTRIIINAKRLKKKKKNNIAVLLYNTRPPI
jgi:hypothetical protein